MDRETGGQRGVWTEESMNRQKESQINGGLNRWVNGLYDELTLASDNKYSI